MTSSGISRRPLRPTTAISARLTRVPHTPGRTTVGRPPTFTNDQVIDAARQAGLATFSVKGVAKELGISPAAIYQRFGSRQGLLTACIAYAFDRVEPLTGAPDEWATLRMFSEQWWALCLRCPNIEIVISDFQDPDILLLSRNFDGYRQRLIDLGRTPEQATFAGSMIAVTLLQLRHRLPAVPVSPDDVPENVDAQRLRSVDFVLDTLRRDWPGWSVQSGAGELS